MDEVRRVKPSTLEELKEVVSDFVACLDEEEVRRAVRDVRPRAELCIRNGGGHFKSQLKKYRRGGVDISSTPGLLDQKIPLLCFKTE